MNCGDAFFFSPSLPFPCFVTSSVEGGEERHVLIKLVVSIHTLDSCWNSCSLGLCPGVTCVHLTTHAQTCDTLPPTRPHPYS